MTPPATEVLTDIGGATYAQLSLLDETDRINWSDANGKAYASEPNTLRFLPMYGSFLTAIAELASNGGLANILLEALRILFR